MLNVKFYNSALEEITAHTYSTLSYPDTGESLFYIQNCCNHTSKLIIGVDYSLSAKNFSTPACISKANITCLNTIKNFPYMELLFVEDNVYVDLANKPTERKTVTLDPDGYYRGIRDVEILFNSIAKNSNARILLSTAKFFSGVAKDNGGVAGDYDKKILFPYVEVDEYVSFWVKFYTKQNMKGEVNPYSFNLVVRVDPVFDA